MTWPALIAELDALSGQALGVRIAELQASLPRDQDRPAPAHWQPGDPRRALCQRVRRPREEDLYGPIMLHLQQAFGPDSDWFKNDHKYLHYPSGRPVHWSLAPGTADIIGRIEGRWIEVEVKRGKGRQSDLQKKREAKVQRSGGIYVVARTPQEAEALIRQALRLRSQCEVLGGMIAAGGPRSDDGDL